MIILLFTSFSHQLEPMVFHLGLSDSKSRLVSRTLPSMVANFINAVVWMISAHRPISNSSNLLTNPFGPVPSAPITTGITVNFIALFFGFLAPSKYWFSFSFLFFLLCGPLGLQSSIDGKALLFAVVNFHRVWSSGRDYVICLYLNITR